MRKAHVWRALLPALLLTVTAVPARAHTEVAKTNPSEGARLTAAPKAVTLTFAEPVSQQGAGVSVAGPQGQTRLQPSIKGAVVTAAWPTSLDRGRFEVSYRVVAQDGHVTSGRLTFRIDEVPSRTTASQAPTVSGQPAATAPGSANSGVVPIWVWVFGLIVLAAAGVAIVSLRRNRGDS